MSSYDEIPSSSSDSDEGLADKSFDPSDFSMKSSVFQDMVHGSIVLHGLCSKIINTSQFNRLRHLKQLGLCCYVYPTGTHSRFEHCIGTCHLAEEYAKILQKNQPELGITEKDILCVAIAGLVHDIGHGPFSHTWEHFMHRYKSDYSHEIMSIKLLDHMISENGLWDFFEAAGLDQNDLIFIKECVLGHPLPGQDTFVGRPQEKWFLYQIVSNEDSKIDVDKFDYMKRDCTHLHVQTSFECKRVMDNSYIAAVPVTGKDNSQTTAMKIVYRKKIKDSLQDLFFSRFRLHQVAYQHRMVKIIETMVLDALHEATGFTVTGKDGTEYPLSRAYEDLDAFTKLTDSIFEIILYWKDAGLNAKNILSKIEKRDLYKSFGYLENPPTGEKLKALEAIHPNLMLIRTKINYGNGAKNPLNEAYFYEKNNPHAVFTCSFPPPTIEEKCYIVLRPSFSESSLANSVSSSGVKNALQDWSRNFETRIYAE